MTEGSAGAGRVRVMLLAFGLSCIAADIVSLLGNRFMEELATEGVGLLPWAAYLLAGIGLGDPSRMIHYPLFFGGILLAQWLFLRPRGDWKVQLAEKARPMKSAIAVAAFMAMLLSVGAMATVVEVFDMNPWGVLEQATAWIDGNDAAPLRGWYAVILAAWGVWTFIFYVYWREGERFGQLGRMITALVAGSVLELFVAIGVYAWNPQKDDCWCGRGSFTGLVFGATVMIWAFGPGLLLLFLRRQRERMERQARVGR